MDLALDIQKLAEDIAETERAYAETRQSFEEKLETMRQALVAQKRLLDSHQPISRLPNELLLRIFTLYHEMSKYDTYRPRMSFLFSESPIRLTHVCSHWRTLVLECPTLWNEVDSLWPEWRIRLVARSREVPLTLYHDGRDRYDDKLFPYVATHYSHRIEDAILEVVSKNDFERFSRLFEPTSKGLKRLAIINHSSYRALPLAPLTAHLSNTVLSLKVTGLWVMEKPLTLLRPTLHTLHLRFGPESQTMHVGECLAAIGNMPHLSSLSLHNLLDDGGRHVTSSFALLRLVALDIEGLTAPCLAFLEHIHAPSLEHIRIFGTACDSIQQYESFHIAIHNIYKTSRVPSSTLALKTSRSSRAMKVTASSTVDLDFPTFFFSIGIELTAPDVLPQGLDFSPLFSLLDLSKLRYLFIHGDLSQPPVWLKFMSYPTITTLGVGAYVISRIHDILRPSLDQIALRTQPFPNLGKLYIEYHVSRDEPPYTTHGIDTAFQYRTPPPSPSRMLEIAYSWSSSQLPSPQAFLKALSKGIIMCYLEALPNETQEKTASRIWHHYSSSVSSVKKFSIDYLAMYHLVFFPQSAASFRFWIE